MSFLCNNKDCTAYGVCSVSTLCLHCVCSVSAMCLQCVCCVPTVCLQRVYSVSAVCLQCVYKYKMWGDKGVGRWGDMWGDKGGGRGGACLLQPVRRCDVISSVCFCVCIVMFYGFSLQEVWGMFSDSAQTVTDNVRIDVIDDGVINAFYSTKQSSLTKTTVMSWKSDRWCFISCHAFIFHHFLFFLSVLFNVVIVCLSNAVIVCINSNSLIFFLSSWKVNMFHFKVNKQTKELSVSLSVSVWQEVMQALQWDRCFQMLVYWSWVYWPGGWL